MEQTNMLISSLSEKLEKLYPSHSPSVLPTAPFTALGLLTTGYLSYRAVKFLYTYLRPSSLPLYQHNIPYSTWALVTGASDGIGHGFAQSLASQGFNVLLHGRNEVKLSGIASELETTYPKARFEIVLADAGSFGPEDISRVVATATSLSGPLTVLVNNVGGGPQRPDPYEPLADTPYDAVDNTININLRFPTHVTRALLPTLVENSPSLIMNIGSAAGEVGIPYIGVYGGCKSFNLRWSEALGREMAAEGHDGVCVQGIWVANVMSGSNKIGNDWFTCESRTMADAALGRVGMRGNVWGWWRHGLRNLLLEVSPTSMVGNTVTQMMRDRKRDHARTMEKK